MAANFPLRVEVLAQRTLIRDGILRVLETKHLPYRVRILTRTIGPFSIRPDRAFEQALKALSSRRVTVSLLFGENPDRMEEAKQLMLKRLEDFGVRVYHHDKVHAKLVFAEGLGWNKLFLGSANMTSNSIDNFHEVAVIGEVDNAATLAAIDSYVNDRLSAPSTSPLSSWSQWW